MTANVVPNQNNEQALNAAGAAAHDVNDGELRRRLLEAEFKALLEKYGCTIAFHKHERFTPNGVPQVSISLEFVPLSRAQRRNAS